MQLLNNTYGKGRVRVVKILREGEIHIVKEVTVKVMLTGDLETSYTAADNSMVVPTDTIKNTVNIVAKDHLGEEIERYAVTLGQHFVSRYDHISTATVEVEERRWERIGDKPHSFAAPGSPTPFCKVVVDAEGFSIDSGVRDWLVMKTTGAGFEGYPKCEFTTLQETNDRIVCTSIEATWRWQEIPENYNVANFGILEAALTPFCDNFSPSVQVTLYQMGEAALNACPEIARIHLAMPNKHCVLVNFAPFELENANEVFTFTDEPHGQIEATIGR